MEKKKVTVFVAGQKFNIVTEEEEKYVIDLAARIDAHISSLTVSGGMSREKAAVLTALDFADDIEQGKRELSQIKEQIKDYIDGLEKLGRENEELKQNADRQSGQNAEIEALRQELSDKERENSELGSKIRKLEEQLASQKSFSEKLKEDIEKAKAALTAQAEKKSPEPQPTVKEETVDVDEDDDLPFDDPVKPAEKAVEQKPQSAEKPQKAPAKKNRHEHNHDNPFKQQFLQKNKGYTPQRQYSLFDDENE